jgi:hypothetical protein
MTCSGTALLFLLLLKNPLPRPGFNLRTFESSGKHTNHYTTEATLTNGRKISREKSTCESRRRSIILKLILDNVVWVYELGRSDSGLVPVVGFIERGGVPLLHIKARIYLTSWLNMDFPSTYTRIVNAEDRDRDSCHWNYISMLKFVLK